MTDYTQITDLQLEVRDAETREALAKAYGERVAIANERKRRRIRKGKPCAACNEPYGKPHKDGCPAGTLAATDPVRNLAQVTLTPEQEAELARGCPAGTLAATDPVRNLAQVTLTPEQEAELARGFGKGPDADR
jgi:hypothetical protein